MAPTPAHPDQPGSDVLSTVHISRATKSQRADGVVATFHQEFPQGWTVNGDISRGPKGLVISYIQAWPGSPVDPPEDSITAKLLQSIRTGQILAAAQLWLDTTAEPGLEQLIDYSLVRLDMRKPPRPSGRAPLTDELLREVAEKYLAETLPGKPRGAVSRIAGQMGKPLPTVSRWVSKAREAGWLGPAAQGREGGEPGPRLFEARAADLERRLHEAAAEMDENIRRSEG